MKYLISEELLSVVLDLPITNIRTSENKKNIFYDYQGQQRDRPCLNIYEFADKCKKWAFNQSTTETSYVIKTVHYGKVVTCGFVGIEETYSAEDETEVDVVNGY